MEKNSNRSILFYKVGYYWCYLMLMAKKIVSAFLLQEEKRKVFQKYCTVWKLQKFTLTNFSHKNYEKSTYLECTSECVSMQVDKLLCKLFSQKFFLSKILVFPQCVLATSTSGSFTLILFSIRCLQIYCWVKWIHSKKNILKKKATFFSFRKSCNCCIEFSENWR